MLELRVLGSIDLTRDDGASVRSVLAQPKRTALLVYLAADRPGEFHRRDTLLAVFWPERDEAHARNSLNQSLHFLRRSLGKDTIHTRGRDEVGVSGDALWCDVAAFQDALEAGDRERALELYRGDLLEGFHLSNAREFERWTDRRRADLRAKARRAALERAETAGDAAEARRWLERSLQISPTDEDVVRELMELLDGAGDRAGALRTYELLATRLERTLGVEPSPETRELAETVRARDRRYTVETTSRPPSRETASGPSADEAPAGASRPRASPPGGTAGRSRPTSDGRRWALYAAVVLVLAVTGLILPEVGLGPASPGPGESPASGPTGEAADERRLDRRTVAVLPFSDLGPSPGGDHFSEGLAEEIRHRLAGSPDLRVVARTSSFQFDEAGLDVRSIGDSLDAGTVLAGTVRRGEDEMRVITQLVDAEAGVNLWSGSYEISLTAEELFDLQERIAGAIADTLRVRLEAPGSGSRSRLPTSDLEAYSLYLRGRHAWNRRTPESFRRAIELYEAALERDSAFARVWAGLAEAYVIIPSSPNVSGLMPEFVTREEARHRARAAAERALALDPNLAQAHAAMGQLRRDEDESRAEEAFRRAIALDPSYATPRQWLAFLLATRGQIDEAVEQLRTARQLDPFSVSINGDLGRFLYYAGDYGEAIRRLRHTLELGTYPQAEWFLTRTLSTAGHQEEARRRLEAEDGPLHGSGPLEVIRATVAARSGREAGARELLARWKKQLAEGERVGEILASERSLVLSITRMHALLGESDSARAWFDRVERWGVGHRLAIRNDPVLAPVRFDGAFQR